MPSSPNSCVESGRIRLLKLAPSRWLHAWWILLHLLLILAALMANPPVFPGAAWLLAVGLHYRLRFPVRGALLLVGPDGRFALPAEGRFDLALDGASAVSDCWAELVFRDRPRSRLLLLRDQVTDSDWRLLCLALTERD